MSEKATLTLVATDTLPIKVEIALPPVRAIMQGFFLAHCIILSKPELKGVLDEGIEDEAFFDMVCQEITGLGTPSTNGMALEGQAAMDEVKKGKFSQYLLPAVVTTYIEQFGEARRKNLPRSQRR